jgi:hypothetical protein
MDLEETEPKNVCAGEGQQESNRPTDKPEAKNDCWLGPAAI